MPIPARITLPENSTLPLIADSTDFQKMLKKKLPMPQSKAFFDILIELIKAQYGQESPLISILKPIWSNVLDKNGQERLVQFLTVTHSVKEFLALLSIARELTIFHEVDLNLKKPNIELQFFQETQERFDFMSRIANELGPALYTREFPREREYFLTNLIQDINNNIRYIGNGFFNFHFKKHHALIALYGKHAIQLNDKVNRKAIAFFNKNSFTEDSKSVFALWIALSFSKLASAKFYLAFGQDECADQYLEDTPDFPNDLYGHLPDNFAQEVNTLLKEYRQEKIRFLNVIYEDKNRPGYLKLLNSIDKDQKIISEGFIRESNDFQCSKKNLKVTPESLAFVHLGMMYVGDAYSKGCDNSLEVINTCKKVLKQIQMILATDKGNVIGIYVSVCLYLYEQNILALEKKLKQEAKAKSSNYDPLKEPKACLAERKAELKTLQKESDASDQRYAKALKPLVKPYQDGLKKVKDLQAKKSSLLTESLDTQSTIENQTKQINQLQEQRSTAKTLSNEEQQSSLKKLQADQAALKQLLEHQAHIDSLTAKIQALKQAQKKAQNNKAKFEMQTSQALSQVSELQKQKEALTQSQPSDSALEDEKEALQKKMRHLQCIHTQLKDVSEKAATELSSQYARSAKINVANIADNIAFADDLAGFQKILKIVSESLASRPVALTHMAPVYRYPLRPNTMISTALPEKSASKKSTLKY